MPYPVLLAPAPGQDGRLRLASGGAVIAAVVLGVLTHRCAEGDGRMRLDIDTVEIPALRPVCECRAGDPDPGPEQHARGGLRGVPCGDVVSYPGAEWLCTLPAGHCGAHIAGDGHTAVAVWAELD